MTTAMDASMGSSGGSVGILDKEHIVAGPGFNRWLVPLRHWQFTSVSEWPTDSPYSGFPSQKHSVSKKALSAAPKWAFFKSCLSPRVIGKSPR